MSRSKAPDEGEIKEVWSGYWSTFDGVAPWDSLSEVVFSVIEREWRAIPGDRILEAGCGTGRISHRLAVAGAQVICLDITEEALQLARGVFAETPGRFVLGSMLDMPKDEQADLIWNAGVIEHFKPEDQMRSIDEFLQILDEGGRVVILTPYSKSLLYRLGMFALKLVGRWPYGVEIPKHTLADVVPHSGHLEREYTVSFLPLIFDAYKFLAPLRLPLKMAWQALYTLLGGERLISLDLFLSKLLGGYLLVSVIAPASSQSSNSIEA